MSLRTAFGYIELILGLILLLSIIFSIAFLIFVFPDGVNEKFNNFMNEATFEEDVVSGIGVLYYVLLSNFFIMISGFEAIIFVLSVFLLFQGILDIRGE